MDDQRLSKLEEEVRHLANRVLELEYAAKFEDIESAKRATGRQFKWMIAGIVATALLGLASFIQKIL